MFENRDTAGEALASKLLGLASEDPIVFALPRGGVPVAVRVAKALKAPLSLLFVRKIGAPGHAELAIGAVVDGDEPTRVLQDEIISSLHVSDLYISSACETALAEIAHRRALYHGLYDGVSPKGRTVLIVDDGLATGASMEVAIKALRHQKANKIVVAVPLAPKETIERFKTIADDVICLEMPMPFGSVGQHYTSFPQLSDADVMEILSNHLSNGGGESLVRKRA